MFAKSLRVWYECGGGMAARVSLERNSKEANLFRKKKSFSARLETIRMIDGSVHLYMFHLGR